MQSYTSASVPSGQRHAQSEQEGSPGGSRSAGRDTAESQAEDPQVNPTKRAGWAIAARQGEMRDLYDQLISDGELAIAQLVAERRQENVALEFKTKANPATGEPSKDDRRNLGIALSALSNSMGGLILWGVSAKKDADGVDCATELQFIAEIERFKADVTRLLSQALMPRHEGIFVEAIPARDRRGAGYLVIYVERSERRPHRCEFVDRQYFKRIGDSSIAMEHYDIEDSFKRLIVPWLEVRVSIAPPPVPDGPYARTKRVQIDIHLTNPSGVTARFPYLTLTDLAGLMPQPQTLSGSHRYYEGENHFSFGVDHVIHPELAIPVARLQTLNIAVEARDGGLCRVRRGTIRPVKFSYRRGCHNSRPTAGEITISEEELVQQGIIDGLIY